MASAPKSSRSRKLPSPRNRDLPTTSGGNNSKPSKETQNGMRDSHGALDVVGTFHFIDSKLIIQG